MDISQIYTDIEKKSHMSFTGDVCSKNMSHKSNNYNNIL